MVTRMPRRPIDEIVRRVNRSDVARRTGIHLSHVSRVLSGKRTASGENLYQLARAIGVDMGDLHQYLRVLRASVKAGRGGRKTPPERPTAA